MDRRDKSQPGAHLGFPLGPTSWMSDDRNFQVVLQKIKVIVSAENLWLQPHMLHPLLSGESLLLVSRWGPSSLWQPSWCLPAASDCDIADEPLETCLSCGKKACKSHYLFHSALILIASESLRRTPSSGSNSSSSSNRRLFPA